MSKLFHFLSYFTITATLAFFGLLICWLVRPYDVPSIQEPITVLNQNKQIRIGEKIQLSLKVHKPNDLRPEGAVYITCNDGNLVTLNPLTSNLPIGDYTVINDQYTLPPKVAVGSKCTFNFQNDYQVNPIRTISKRWASEPFEVIK